MSRQWLIAHVPGFSNLPTKDRSALMNFVFLWTLFEAQVMENRAQINRLVGKVDEWNVSGILHAGDFDRSLEYFRKRYYRDGAFTDNFFGLNLRPTDHPQLVRDVLSRVNENPRDRVLVAIIVIWRYRNNLFHGGKWSYRMIGQRQNFLHASDALMKVLERHGNLGD